MFKNNKNKKSNKGSSFFMVIVAISFIAILSAALIVAVALSYRLKAMDINNKNNFYYIEKALDEIYAGVGTVAIEDLKTAYSETVDIMVYYDTDKNTYVTISEASANKILKEKFAYYVGTNDKLAQVNLYNTLNSFISDPYDASTNKNGVKLSDSSGLCTVWDKGTNDGDSTISIQRIVVSRETEDGYEQSITTDLIVNQPNFMVSFSGINNDLSSLFNFAIIADRGLEVTDGARVVLAGNIYAAADYYNKEYDTDVCSYSSVNGTDVDLVEKYNACNGLDESSMNSGIYVTDASSLTVQGEDVIVPGAISAFNSSSIALTNKSMSGATPLEIWCDNIILGGNIIGNKAAKLDISGNTHVSDDLELNADGAKATLYGGYYGYNYSQKADDTYMTLVSSAEKAKAHINSSSIVINGVDTTLDLVNLKELVIAGRSYIETTKHTDRTETEVVDEDGKKNTVVTKTYSYISNDESEDKVAVEDYATGESLSVKSNQLAYMPMYTNNVSNYTTLLGVIPCTCGENHNFANELNKQNPIITYELNGDKYYFFNFVNKKVKACYIASYAAYLEGEHASSDFMNDILNYKNFSVDNISIPENNVYSSGALSVVKDNKLTITAAADNIEDILTASIANDNYGVLYKRSKDDNETYKKMKYLLKDYDDDAALVSDDTKEAIKKIDNDAITPLNTYLDYSKVGTTVKHTGIIVNNDCRVWVVDGDVNITSEYADDKGVVKGIIICTGDVTFEKNNASSGVVGIKRFEGMVVAGGKVKVDHTMNLIANAQLVKSILSDCSVSKDSDNDYSDICEVFKDYQTNISSSTDDKSKTISAIEIKDILGFYNWKRNVE